MESIYCKSLHLQEFWVMDPIAWFEHVEAHLELENLDSQQHRYINVIMALSQDSFCLIKDIIAILHPSTLRGFQGQAPEQLQPHQLPEDREAVQYGARGPAETAVAAGTPDDTG